MSSAAKIFYPYALNFGAFALTQLEASANPEYNWEDATYTPPGSVFPTFTGMEYYEPKLETTTTQIKTVLDAIAANGVEGVARGFTDPVDFSWLKGQNLGSRHAPTDAEHSQVRANNSLFFWKGIKAGEKGFVNLDFCWKPIIDADGNPPWVPANGIALPALSPEVELYKTGPVVANIAGQPVVICNDGWNWDNQIKLRRKACGGKDADDYVSIENVAPKVMIPTESVDDVISLSNGQSISSIDVYLRRHVQGGTIVPPDVPQHIKFSSVVGTMKPENARSISAMMHSFTFDTASVIPS